MKAWYVVQTKPRQEAMAAEQIANQAFEIYLPRISMKKRRRGKWQEVIEPLFPRYLFMRFDPESDNVAPIRSTKGITGLVKFGPHLAPVSDALIDSIRQEEDTEAGCHLPDQAIFKRGDRVEIMEGPFAGLQGLFQESSGEQRVIILLELLGRANSIVVAQDRITPSGEVA